MSILIKGMEMPMKENAVILITPNGDVWMIGDMPNEDTHLVKTQAIPVPPHGDLIDRDALETDAEWDSYEDDYISYSKLAIKCAPTIIEAEEGET